MEESQLIGIINRLKAMQEDTGDEPQPRRFEKEGVELAQVVYHPETQTYSLDEHQAKEHFEFDNIDLIAIELFELLTDN
ncbi:YkuJ family protein [Secundilactobacillus hailunensis]|uniref:YkuJ family protein n=1 Tax=Secundilactobacillus hailunensis TaxID=2559923 RepID=A0ABW1T5G4_9LACO|nr:YkuJ family protein [Secundilactobacillus hailunensis]